MGTLVPETVIKLEVPKHNEKGNELLAKLLDCEKTKDGWWVTPNGQCIVNAPVMRELLERTHKSTHMGADALVFGIKRYGIGPRVQQYAEGLVKQCQVCCKNNPKIEKKPSPGEVK